MLRTLALCAVGQAGAVLAAAANAYTWPAETDFLEGLLYEHVGRDAFTPAAVVSPCGIVDLGGGRNVAAEWLRTAYHDMATADVKAGTGGIDASIGFELDRPENPGMPSFNETLRNMQQHLTAYSSMADLVAMGAVLSAGACSNGKVIIPYRAGRIDATKAGPAGVPQPQESIESHVSAFERQGFTKTEMIGLVACGHTLGGVHGTDFPTIVEVPANDTEKSEHIQTFDETTLAFDNTVAQDFVGNKTQNVLAFGHNETTRSDARIFNSDNAVEIKKLAASNDYFLKTCTSLIERMVNTVPEAVTLGLPIPVVTVKPLKLFASVNIDGTLTMTGQIRLVDTFGPNPNRTVTVSLRDRQGTDCTKTKSCVVVSATPDEQSWTTSGYPLSPVFKRYAFTATVPVARGISSFNITVADKTDKGTTKTVYTNNGKGYQFDDTILPQPDSSCADRFSTGLMNLTVAVRDGAKLPQFSGVVQTPSSLAELVPSLKTVPLNFNKIGHITKAGYTLYNAQHTGEVGTYRRMYNLVASSTAKKVENVFNDADNLPGC